jgi:hypothetical protein
LRNDTQPLKNLNQKMKKFLLAFAMLIIISTAEMHQVKAQTIFTWPFGAVTQTSLSVTASADTISSVKNNMSYAYVADTLHGALSIVVIPSSELRVGAILLIKTKCGAVVHTVTFSTGFTGVALTGTANKTKLSTFWYDGSKFLSVANTQIN